MQPTMCSLKNNSNANNISKFSGSLSELEHDICKLSNSGIFFAGAGNVFVNKTLFKFHLLL